MEGAFLLEKKRCGERFFSIMVYCEEFWRGERSWKVLHIDVKFFKVFKLFYNLVMEYFHLDFRVFLMMKIKGSFFHCSFKVKVRLTSS